MTKDKNTQHATRNTQYVTRNSQPATRNSQPATRNSQPDSAFTLLEILIAIFIFSIIVTTIFGSFNSVFSNAETINKGIETHEMAKNCLSRMIIDLQSMYASLPPGYSSPDFDDPPDPYRFVGDSIDTGDTVYGRLRFTSLAHILSGNKIQEEIAEIIYYVQAANDGSFVLRRSDTLYPYEPFEEKGEDPLLCEQVKSLEFLYYDQDNTEYNFWDSESDEFNYATPMAVGIKLEIGDNSDSLLFETMVTFPVYRE